MCNSTNQAQYVRESVQNSRQAIDTLPLSWYSLTHINHFTVINSRPATAPNHFAAIHLRQNPLVPCGAVFFIFRENLQPDHRPAILYTRTLKVSSAVWIWIPRHDPAQSAGEPDNAAATQGQERRFGASGDPRNRRHFYWHLHSQLWKPKSSLKAVFSFWTGKAISKYRPVATISKIEIASH